MITSYNKAIYTAQSATNSFTSVAFQLERIYGYSIQAVYTGTINGSFKLQGSADPTGDFASPANATNIPTNWSDIAGTTNAVTTSGNYLWNMYDVGYNWVRVVFTDNGGGTSTGTVAMRINAKGV